VQRNQYILIGSGILLFVLIYFCGRMVGNKPPSTNKPTANRDMSSGMPNPMADVVPIQIEPIIQQATLRLTGEIKTHLDHLNMACTNNSSAITNKDLAEFWEGQKELNISAFYYKRAALLENTEKSLTFAGKLFVALLQRTNEAEVRKWQALEAIECLNKVLSLNSSSIEAKVALANCYTDGTGETMKGVGLLREVAATDSNNVPANMLLGKLSIQSQQWEKAIMRFEKVIAQDKKNLEAMYFLAQAYNGSKNYEKAIALLENCKKMETNPQFIAEIDKEIQKMK